MSKYLIRFPFLFLIIAAHFYFMNLHSVDELNGFLSNAVRKTGSVLDRLPQSPHPQKRHPHEIFYLLQVDNPSPLDPARVWATGGNTRLGIGDVVTFYYHPNNPDDVRVIDGKEISRYRKEFFFNSLLLTFFAFYAWLVIEKEILEKEAVYPGIG
jgi:hypothetical protein